MSKKEYFISTVKNGKLSGVTANKIHSYIGLFEGKKLLVTVEKLTAKRSLQQNKYLHVLLTIFTQALNDLGNDFMVEEIKDLCKLKFAKQDLINEDTGEIIGQSLKHTASMNKIELGEFIDNIILWAQQDFNIKLPIAGEFLELEFKD